MEQNGATLNSAKVGEYDATFAFLVYYFREESL